MCLATECGPVAAHAALRAASLARRAAWCRFAGYEMPVQYPAGIIAEHLHTRAQAGLFDVSHMGQVRLRGANSAAALEALVPGDIAALAPMRMRYTLLLNERGGILDDLMVTRLADEAGRADAGRQCRHQGGGPRPSASRARQVRQDRAAARPRAAGACRARRRLPCWRASSPEVERHAVHERRRGRDRTANPASSPAPAIPARTGSRFRCRPAMPRISRERLLAEPEVAPIGLGARDSLRLEAGLCLYGHDIDETTDPIEAGLAWTIGKRRRAEGGFPGADAILRALRDGPRRKRVGIRPDGRAPAREGTAIVDEAGKRHRHDHQRRLRPERSAAPIAMGYVDRRPCGRRHGASIARARRSRGRPASAELPFVPHRYYRG